MVSSSPLPIAELACGALAGVCWLASIVTGNYSQVDRLWSIAPPLYVAGFAAAAGFRDPRLDVMSALTALWGARLTYNFARKGGYRAGSEDYRWPVLRRRFGPVRFQLFNATFIARTRTSSCS
jgi:steroid 5-alpha reductase family enzyme